MRKRLTALLLTLLPVICLAQAHFSRIEIVGDRLHCGAGAKLKAAAMEAKRGRWA